MMAAQQANIRLDAGADRFDFLPEPLQLLNRFAVAGSPSATYVRISSIGEHRREPLSKWSSILFHVPC
jgi:hypothetical protein